uniref:Uncharacterized protein n=1 Tax=Tanacetum cinerariifolium TaxID=118510 RepID=A0A6L2NZ44_TANCI|nr:hypothetical protein [Tanacetum cinerariifolium]
MINVAAVKYARVSTSNPTLYMWWLQTTKPNTPIDIIAYTIPKYPNTLLFELAEIVVLIIPKPGSPPPATSKNDVLKFLSVNTIVIAPASTGNDNNNNTAVTRTAHPNRANLCNLIPGLLIFKMVVIKFIAPRRLLIPDRCKAKMARSTLGPL